jgi:hypothetical protein
MNNTILQGIRFLTLSAAMTWIPALHADEPMEVRWNEVCRVTAGHQLEITTTTGDVVGGYCMAINVDEISVTTRDRRVVKIARAALSRVQMHRSRNGHGLNSLRKGMHEGLRQGFEWLFSPYCATGHSCRTGHSGVGSGGRPVLPARRLE